MPRPLPPLDPAETPPPCRPGDELARLRAALEAAEARSRAKSDFLASMSHELRTPLNAIIGFSEIMRDECFGPIGSERYKGYAGDVHESARHLLRLINDMLDMAKIEAGKLELEESSLEPAELLHAVLRLAAPAGEGRRAPVETELPADLPLLTADERKLKQILVNLLSNALKFTPVQGCVVVSLRREPDGGFSFLVSDNGIGMAPPDIAVALTPFGQVANRQSRQQEGTGLGLPLSKALAELHGGSLELESALGAGTTATLRLPAWRVQGA